MMTPIQPIHGSTTFGPGGLSALIGAGLLVAASACARDEQAATAPTTGTVYLDGQPVPEAHVTFLPAAGPVATARTGSDGSYQLQTDAAPGAAVGVNLVMVTRRENPTEPQEFEADNPLRLPVPGRSLLPERYGNTATSGLEFEVTPGRENVFDIHLSSD